MSTDLLSTWSVASGVSWIQTNNPQYAKKLAKRSDTRLVAVGVAGGFLRIYEMKRPPAFMRRLVHRYETANARFLEMDNTKNSANCPGKVMSAPKAKQRDFEA